jgi:hypothetical protein
MTIPIPRNWWYRIAAIAAFIIAQIIVLAIPMKMQEPGDWTYRYGSENFAAGQLTISDSRYIEESQAVWDSFGQLLGYARVGDDKWGLTVAPGYIFFLTPFQAAGIPKMAASLLSLGLAVVLYLLLARMKSERAAVFGVILLLFTPLYLAMWQRVYMDSLAALAFCGIGGGLYFYYWITRDRYRPGREIALLSAAGFFIAAGTAVRYTNIFIAGVFGVHFVYMAVRCHIRRERFLPNGLYFLLGAALPVAGLLAYQAIVFGSPFSYGYQFSQLPINFAWQYIGGPIAYQIVRTNFVNLWATLLIAFLVSIIAVPAFLDTAYFKLWPRRKYEEWTELPGHIYLVMLGWVVAVFGLYIMYDWTAYQPVASMPFPLLTRFFLPVLFPLVLLAALELARMADKAVFSILVVAAALGIIFFAQAARMQVAFAGNITVPSLSLPAQNGPDRLLPLVGVGARL